VYNWTDDIEVIHKTELDPTEVGFWNQLIEK
jgi:hypothetical protein